MLEWQNRSVQFSVTNTDGKIFTVSCPVDAGIFENIVGTFDGKTVKIYVNGSLRVLSLLLEVTTLK